MVYLIESSVERGAFDSYEESEEDWTEDIPLGRLGDPNKLGNLVAFLSSDLASFITGEAVMIDGGAARSNL